MKIEILFANVFCAYHLQVNFVFEKKVKFSLESDSSTFKYGTGFGTKNVFVIFCPTYFFLWKFCGNFMLYKSRQGYSL